MRRIGWLLAIKAQIKQDLHNYNAMSSWNESTHFCMWHGVTCSRRHRQRVTTLDPKSGRETIPNIGNLSFLRELRLQNNSFSHEIPPQIGNLRKLQVLHLNNNSFSGSIPLSNNLMGNIPSSLGQLKKLTFLGLGINQLSGSIPSSIYNLSSLVTFSMILNQIQGSIPSDIGKNLPNLEIFNVFSNQLTGSIPPSIFNVTSVWFFDVGNNNLIGQVPNIQKLHNLQIFFIEYNYIGSGKNGDLSFLSDLTNATQLKELIISNNNFGGTLPMSISNLSTKLEML